MRTPPVSDTGRAPAAIARGRHRLGPMPSGIAPREGVPTPCRDPVPRPRSVTSCRDLARRTCAITPCREPVQPARYVRPAIKSTHEPVRRRCRRPMPGARFRPPRRSCAPILRVGPVRPMRAVRSHRRAGQERPGRRASTREGPRPRRGPPEKGAVSKGSGLEWLGPRRAASCRAAGAVRRSSRASSRRAYRPSRPWPCYAPP